MNASVNKIFNKFESIRNLKEKIGGIWKDFFTLCRIVFDNL